MQGLSPFDAYRRSRASSAIGRAWRARRAFRTARGRTKMASFARGMLAARVHGFKRVTDAFGLKAGISGSTTYELVNTGSSPNQLLAIGNVSSSQFFTGAYQFGGAFQFMLSHVSNVSEITNLFDNYRIKNVIVKVMPQFNSSDVLIGATGYAALPTMHYTIDQDDATIPSNRTAVLENSYCKSVRLDRPFSIVIKPRAQNVIATTAGAASGGMLPSGQWLDSATQTVPHYGLKFWMDDWNTVTSASPSQPCVKFIVTYTLECKNVT